MALKLEVDLSEQQLKKIAEYISTFGLLPDLESKEKPLAEQFMTVKQVAHFTNQSTQTVINHIKQGLLKSSKIGKFHRISRQDLKDYTHGE